MRINNPHDIPCSIEGCNSIYIARKKGWLCSLHLQIEYNKKNSKGKKKWDRKSIPKKSAKRIIEEKIYIRTRKEFLSLPENKICFIENCSRPANSIEHSRGRCGSLYLDQRYWKPCCWKHNGELETNPELSKKYQLSKLHGGKKI